MSTIIENSDKNTNITSVVEVKPAVPPDGLTEKQVKDLNTMADDAINALVKVKGDIFTEEADSVVNVGLKDQKEISNNIQLMQERMGNVFYSKEKDDVAQNMSKDIAQLQSALAKVSPKYIQREARYQFIKRIPFFGNYIANVLKESTTRGMTLKGFIDDISDSLKQAELNIKQDNAQLKVINGDLKGKQLIVLSNAYYAERLIQRLSEEIKNVEDISVKNNLNEILARITSRLQNIRTTENAMQQFLTSIKMHRTNNDYLLDSGREMQINGMMIVNISTILHSALIRSKNAKDLLVGVGEFGGKMLEANAVLINKMTTEIGEIRKNPYIATKYIENSIAQLTEAIDKTNKINLEVIENGKANATKIKIWTEDLKTKSGELPDVDVKSLEASKVLLLDSGK